MRTVIFDLDGTLADTSADLIAAANACFRGLGHGDLLSPVADAHTAFRGGRAMLRLGFERLGHGGEAEIAEQYPVLLDYYGEHIDVHTRLYDGAAEAVEALRAAGYALGICTNKPEDLADRLLMRLGVRDLFGAMIGARTVGVSKPDPKPYVAAVEGAGGTVARSFLVGDTETDRATARAAGVPCALVTFGPDGDRVAALEPEALLGHYGDLADVTRELIG
ncbi:HAD-IA family hydrolase [Celeribacter indicus]|uniref:phosphoglycolate phosphatase n=1 Tax=Celeribacter indicus TaxID=1208324 RepID=A0A0B5E5C2_9RHOB|nr:HAD-IA family hydrolase [Celeribacter indicus]AJE48166.1 HAD family hydrolase [Celeribacter indicus]SDW34242.1 phosphoglycolate phosphatase [Celeribacter indicus]